MRYKLTAMDLNKGGYQSPDFPVLRFWREYMKKIISFLLCISALAGCNSGQTETTTSETTTITVSETAETATSEDAATVKVTTTTAVSTVAPEYTELDGLRIYEEDALRVVIPADYTNEDIGSFFNALDDNIIFEPVEDGIFCVADGALYSKDMTKLYSAPYQCEDEHNILVPIVGLEKSFTVPESVTWIAPNAFYKECFGRVLDVIYVYEGISGENIAELNLGEFTTVQRAKKEEKSSETSEKQKRIRKWADFFNNSEEEMAFLIANITERAGENYTFSKVSGEGAEAHIYMYKSGEPAGLAVIYNYGDEPDMFYESADKSLVYQLYITSVPENFDGFYINEAQEMNPHNN